MTERVIAGRKADGRLPKLRNGAIDLHAVIRAGVAALAERHGRNSPGDDPDPAEAFDAACRMGASVTAHLIVTKAGESGASADLGTIAAVAIRETLEMVGLVDTGPPVPARLVPLGALLEPPAT